MRDVRLCYPNFSRKAITFTIDDGNLASDEKFISIVKPAGIVGTFNLCSNRVKNGDRDFYRAFYEGYEIANHCKYHPFATDDNRTYTKKMAEEKCGAAPDETVLYTTDIPGLYDVLYERGWRQTADTESYIRFADESRAELESVFGEGSVGSYVWPFSQQNNAEVKKHLENSGYYAIRKTGCVLDTTGFAPPTDLMAWSYNADNRCLLSVAELYESYPDDGELKFFAFGVHSWDFERDGNWCDLERFAELYGSRPEDFWYATVRDIFEYVAASKALRIEGDTVVNGSCHELYFEYNGERRSIPANTELPL